MIRKLLSVFMETRLTVPASKAEQTVNFLLQGRYSSFAYEKTDSLFSFSMPLFDVIRFTKESASYLPYCKVEKRGLLPMVWKCRRRFGIACGAAVAVFLSLICGGRVWDVRISGNETVSSFALDALLEEKGLYVGTKIAEFDRSGFANAVLNGSEALSYVAVNFHGNVAYVQVRESKTPQQTQKEEEYADLAAGEEGVVLSLSVKAGVPAVHAGTVVKRGDLLVSGTQTKGAGEVYCRATGEIYARVQHTHTVTLPAVIEKETDKDSVLVGVSLRFFEKTATIYENLNNLPLEYDTIYKNKDLYIGNELKLPFSLSLRYASCDRQETKTLAEEETVVLAYQRMAEYLSVFLADKELLTKSYTGSFQNGKYTLVCQWEDIENIAVEVPITQK